MELVTVSTNHISTHDATCGDTRAGIQLKVKLEDLESLRRESEATPKITLNQTYILNSITVLRIPMHQSLSEAYNHFNLVATSVVRRIIARA